MYFYKSFRLEAHYKNIFNQIRRCLTRFTSLEAVIRTRFSRGYKIGSFVTPVLISNNDLLICPTLDSDQTYTVGLEVVDPVDQLNNVGGVNPFSSDPLVYVQVKNYFKFFFYFYLLNYKFFNLFFKIYIYNF